LAEDNLRLGMSVVADSVNPISITRRAWRDVAVRAAVAFVEIEVICSDAEEHRRRVETRSCDIPGLRLPTWNEVESRVYDPWETAPLVVDTAGRTEQDSFATLLSQLK
jgi:predicted kinase